MSIRVKTFIATVDGSESATRALDVAIALTKAASGTLSLLAVAVPLTQAEQTAFERAEGNVADVSDMMAQQILKAAEHRLDLAGLTAARTLLKWGDPAEAILDAIADLAPDAIVVGRRGRGRLTGLLLGSVSQKLVSLAPCIVVVVP